MQGQHSVWSYHILPFPLSLLGRPVPISSYLTGNWNKEGSRFFSEVLSCSGLKIQHKEQCSIKTQAHEVEECRPSETLKVQRDTAPSNPLCVWSWRWDRMTSRGKALPHLNSCVTLMRLVPCVLRHWAHFTYHHWCRVSPALSSAGALPSWLKYCTSCLEAIGKAHGSFCASQLALYHARWHSKLADTEASSPPSSEFILGLSGLLQNLTQAHTVGPSLSFIVTLAGF